MRRLAGFAAGIVLGVVVIACADAGAQDDVGERVETPGDFDDVYTFCSHGIRVFLTETDVESSSAIAIAPRNPGYGGNGC